MIHSILILCSLSFGMATVRPALASSSPVIDAWVQGFLPTDPSHPKPNDIPAIAIVVGSANEILFSANYGWSSLFPRPEPLLSDVLFDLASMTKPIATAFSVQRCMQLHGLQPETLVVDRIPELKTSGVAAATLTLSDLLRHRSGLPPMGGRVGWWRLDDEAFRSLRWLKNITLQSTPGTRFDYSDLGFALLGEWLRRECGQDLEAFAEAQVFKPMGLEHTVFRPLAKGFRPEDCAATVRQSEEVLRVSNAIVEQKNQEDHWLRCEVHDPLAHARGGVLGNAGLFSSITDLGRLSQMILQSFQKIQMQEPFPLQDVLDADHFVDLFTDPHPLWGSRRGLGWDIESAFSAPKGILPWQFSTQSFGHTGFTGTSFWIDPEQDRFVVILTNCIHMQTGRYHGCSPVPIWRLRSEIVRKVLDGSLDQD